MIEVKQPPVLINPAFYKLTDEEYFSRDEMSNSDISKFRQSPKAFKYYKEHGGFETTDSMLIGSMVHCLYLEPELFEDTFAIAPKVDRRTKAGKEIYAEYEKKSVGKKVVSQDLYDKALQVYEGLVGTLGSIKDIAGEGHAEITGLFTIKDVKCRMKVDYLSNEGVIWDLKTTKSLTDFARSIANFGYHRQVAMYYAGVQKILGHCKGFKFIAVENREPFDAAIFKLDTAGFQVGLDEITQSLEEFKTCRSMDSWRGAFQGETVVSLPRWYGR